MSLPPDSMGGSRRAKLRALVVDDTSTYRTILRAAVDEIPEAVVVAVASSGRAALERLAEERIDIVVMDVEMPEMNGLETLEQIRRTSVDVGVVLVSGGSRTAAELTVEALSRGALDFVPKVEGGAAGENRERLVRNLRRVLLQYLTRRHLADVRAYGKSEGLSPAARPALLHDRAECLLIATSTGGPQALGRLIPALPADLPVPVFVVQHMPPSFTLALASLLDSKSAVGVCEAKDGQPIEAGTVYVAPGGKHMVIRAVAEGAAAQRRTIGINEAPPVNNVRPSADVLFRSAAVAYQGHSLAVVLTGMGQDGVSGVRALKQRGAYCITQSADSSVIYGMPRATVEAGLSDEAIDLDEMPKRLLELLRRTPSGWGPPH